MGTNRFFTGITGGRRILQQFVNESDDFVLPYIDGTESTLEEHLLMVNGR